MGEGESRNGVAIGVGVTGHRRDRLGFDRLDWVEAQTSIVMEAIEAACAAPLRLITSLADGADSIAAKLALGRGWPVDAVLPFSRSNFAQDHDPAERAAFLNNVAATRDCFELAAPRTGSGDAAAYERAGRLVLSQSDVLIAVWDGKPSRGRGGTPQIVAEAVAIGMPVIVIDPETQAEAVVLWDGLSEHELGQQTVETVARAPLSVLPSVMAAAQVCEPVAPTDVAPPRRSFAYTLLLVLFGVRPFRSSAFTAPDPETSRAAFRTLCGPVGEPGFATRLDAVAGEAFARTDVEATATARAYRSSYVANFALAALAVVLAMSGLVVPYALKPFIVIGELATIAIILLQTRGGNRARLHARWLDNRDIAERLRCLALSAQLGELDLRTPEGSSPPAVLAQQRTIARRIGLPSAVVDDAYLARVRDALRGLLDDQIGYLHGEAHAMHHLDHRLHLLGTFAFALTAGICATVFALEWLGQLHVIDAHGLPPILFLVATMLSAALPAIGAAIYGIRMQGDFAGICERNRAVAVKLEALRTVDATDPLAFDTLKMRITRATAVLTEDRMRWRQVYDARPLTLPG